MKAPPPDVIALRVEAQQVALTAGPKKMAEVVGKDVITKMALNHLSRDSGMYKKTYDNKTEAEAWLDEKEK